MRIESISIGDFLSYKNATLTIPRQSGVTFVLGRNHAGKTPLKRAVNLLLTGGVQDLAGTGTTLDRLIRLGAQRAIVEGSVIVPKVDKPLAVKRSIGPKGVTTSVNGHKVSNDISDFVALGIPDPESTLSVLVNVSGFFLLKPAKQKELLLGLIDQSVPVEALADLPMENRCEPPKTFAEVDAAHKALFAERTKLNSRFDALDAPDEKVAARKVVDLAPYTTLLGTLTTERDALLVQSGERIAERKRLETEQSNAETALTDAENIIGSDTIEPLERTVRDAEGTYEARRTSGATLSKKREEHAVALATVTTLTEARKRLADQKTNAECHTCFKPLGRVDREVIDERLTSRIKYANEDAERLAHEIEELAREGSLTEAESTLKTARKKLDTLRKNLAERERLTTLIADLKKRIADMPDDSADATKLEELRARITNGNEAIAGVRRRNEEREAALALIEKRRGLEENIAAYNTLVNAFGPKGLKERLLVERVSSLVQSVNTKLSTFGLAIEFADDPWEVRVNGVVSTLLGESEAFVVGVALQVALAEVTGAKFVFIDGADVFDGPNRAALFKTLATGLKNGWIEQAIVTATYSNDDALKQRFPSSWAVFHLTKTADKGSTFEALNAEQKSAA